MSVVMMLAPLRYYKNIKFVNHGFFALGHGGINPGCKAYSKDKGSCCKDVSQTEGKKIELWPKADSPPVAWRAECPRGPQPPNYDPYRIKVPDVVVPPLPPSNAKRSGVVLTSTEQGARTGTPAGPHAGPRAAPDHRDHDDDDPEHYQQSAPPDDPKHGGFMGLLRGLFDRLKGKSKGGSDAMITGQACPLALPIPIIEELQENALMPMLDCALTRGPCSAKPAPPPPPCPTPPPKPFPWIYVWLLASFCSIVGVIYKVYVWKEEQERLGESRPIWRPRRKTKRPYHDKDLPACVQYLIVGAGAAGWAAYRAIMHHDKKAKVFFISKEDCLPYMRPPMSKFMWWNPDPPDIKTLNFMEEGRRTTMYLSECAKFLDPVKFYRKKTGPAVSIATGWCVLRVDADEHVVYVKTMCGEQPVYYERCLLAPGSKAKVLSVFKSAPKAVRDKVSTIRTIRDLEIAYRKVKAAKHVVIIGGGTLGCELAWHLGKMNQKMDRPPDEEPIQLVHMFKDKGLMAGVLPEYLGEWAAEKIKCEGVTVMPKTQVYDAFESPDGRLELTLSDGSSLITDYVLVAVGAEPRVEIAAPSFLEQDHVNGGFKVNTELEARTHLYVAGDAASFYSQWHDMRLRTEHYDNAEEQGYIAGANMTGYWLPCNMEPHYWLRLGHELEMQVVGEVGACLPTVALFKRCADEPAMKAQAVDAAAGDRPCYKKSEEYQNRYKRGILFYLRDEIVVGMVFWNLPPIDDRKEVVTEMLRARPSYKDINMLAELLGFPDTQCTYLPDEQLKDPGPCIKNWRVF